MLTANLNATCVFLNYNVVEYMAGWIPIKFMGLTYYDLPKDVDNRTVTFRLMWFTSTHIMGLFSLMSIILEFFFLVDMMLTWKHPMKYISGQKFVVPIFLLGAKISQFILFAIFEKFRLIKLVSITAILFQIVVALIFFGIVILFQCKNHYDSRITKLVYR